MTGNRRTGRTTRMLLTAAVAVSRGLDVLLVGHDMNYSKDLARQLRSICTLHHIPFGDGQIRWRSQNAPGHADAHEIFVDHYAGGEW